MEFIYNFDIAIACILDIETCFRRNASPLKELSLFHQKFSWEHQQVFLSRTDIAHDTSGIQSNWKL